MARTALTPQSFPLASGASYFPSLPLSAGTAKLNFAAADASNFNVVPIVGGKTVVLAQNTDVSAHTVTFHSIADAQGRTGDITAYSIPAGETHAFGPFVTTPVGWNQTSPAGLWLDANSALIFFEVLTLP